MSISSRSSPSCVQYVPLDLTLSLQSYLLSDFPSLPFLSGDLDRAVRVGRRIPGPVNSPNEIRKRQTKEARRATREDGTLWGELQGPSITREGRKATKRGRGSWQSISWRESLRRCILSYWRPQTASTAVVSVDEFPLPLLIPCVGDM